MSVACNITLHAERRMSSTWGHNCGSVDDGTCRTTVPNFSAVVLKLFWKSLQMNTLTWHSIRNWAMHSLLKLILGQHVDTFRASSYGTTRIIICSAYTNRHWILSRAGLLQSTAHFSRWNIIEVHCNFVLRVQQLQILNTTIRPFWGLQHIGHTYWRYKVKVKCTVVQALRLCTGRTAHRGSRGIALLFHDHGTRRRWGVSVTPGLLFTPRGKTRYPLCRRLCGPQGRSGQVRIISPPPGFDPRTVQPVASRYTDYATRPTMTIQTSIHTHTDIYIYIYIYIQGVPGGMCQTSGGCSLC